MPHESVPLAGSGVNEQQGPYMCAACQRCAGGRPHQPPGPPRSAQPPPPRRQSALIPSDCTRQVHRLSFPTCPRTPGSEPTRGAPAARQRRRGPRQAPVIVLNGQPRGPSVNPGRPRGRALLPRRGGGQSASVVVHRRRKSSRLFLRQKHFSQSCDTFLFGNLRVPSSTPSCGVGCSNRDLVCTGPLFYAH